jgi:hypothetical protein
MKKADQKQLKAMLGPIAQTWFRHKHQKVQAVFEQEISGDLLQAVERVKDEAERLIAGVEADLDPAREGFVR